MAARRMGPNSRVTTACSACRTRRTKCITDPGETACKYCRGKDQECIFPVSDERKRPNSKVYQASLLANIESLEQRLREIGHEPPQLDCVALPKSQRPRQEQRPPSHGPMLSSNPRPTTTAVLSQQPQVDNEQRSDVQVRSRAENSTRQRSASEPQLDRNKNSTVWTLIYGPDRLLYDKERGRIHYFSPSTCFKNYMRDNMKQGSWNMDKCTYRILTEIPDNLDNYLMELFWQRYNNTLRVIDQDAFSRDRSSGDSTFYSSFLHLVCLAMGFQFADQDRPDIRNVTLNNGSSLFQREVKYILDPELENPRGLTTIQAMLVLSDVECACGRDDLAIVHIGTSCRLAFDFGLTLDCSHLGLTEAEMKFRRKLLRSCMIYDRAWALYLGRPASMKLGDIASSCLTMNLPDIASATASSPSSLLGEHLLSDPDMHGQISHALLDLAELCLKIQEIAQPRLISSSIADEDRLVEVAVMDNKLRSWFAALPDTLRWTLENAKSAPPLFFMMHQQFHVARILLYGPYGHYEDVVGIELAKSHVFGRNRGHSGQVSPWQRLARSVTMEAAIKLAQSFSAYRQRWGTSQTNVLSLQQGGTTCLTLMCIIKASRTTETRNLVLQHLCLLMEQLEETSAVYSSAKVICSVVKHEMEQLRIDPAELLTPPQTPDAFDSQSQSARAHREGSETPSEADPTPKRPRLSDNDLASPHPTRASAALPAELVQDLDTLSQSRTTTNTGARGITESAIQSESIGVPQGTFFDVHLEPMQQGTDPMFPLHMSPNTSLPRDFYALSTSFDDRIQDYQANELLPTWWSDDYFPDLVEDGGTGSLPDMLQY